jgi:hypothetical protein
MTEEAETRPTPAPPVAEPPQTTPEPEVEPPRPEDGTGLRCTLCGLRACWTA